MKHLAILALALLCVPARAQGAKPNHPVTHAYTTPDGKPITTIAPGDTIAIRGEGFGEAGQVLVNFHPTPHRTWTPTVILLRLPDTLSVTHPPTITVRRSDGKSYTGMMRRTAVTPPTAKAAK